MPSRLRRMQGTRAGPARPVGCAPTRVLQEVLVFAGLLCAAAGGPWPPGKVRHGRLRPASCSSSNKARCGGTYTLTCSNLPSCVLLPIFAVQQSRV